MGLIVVLAVGAIIIAVIVMAPRWRAARRLRLQRRSPPTHWHGFLYRDFALYRRLPCALQERLQEIIQVLLAEKQFIGRGGLTLTEDMKVLIAAQAGLPLLNRNDGYYDELRAIIVYPGAFLVDGESRDEAGVHSRHRSVLSGESWDQGRVVLSWEDVANGARRDSDGINVVLHEFAHQLDQESGVANGAPPLESREQYRGWSDAFTRAYAELMQRVENGEPTVIDHYGAVSPAEFFAVATEVFFERPVALRSEHPELYDRLKNFYRLDPVEWN